MGDVVNLRTARKRAARKTKDVRADANRIAFGTPTRTRKLAAQEAERAREILENHRLDPSVAPTSRDAD